MSQQNGQQNDDRDYTEQMFKEYYGERLAGLPADRVAAACDLFGEVMWHEGIEALTPERLDTILEFTILDFTAETLPHAA
ncbi:hypothetical protein [Azospirillum sp. sgz302134]